MKRLCELINPSLIIYGSPETMIGSIQFDSRKVDGNCLFIALKGTNTDGHNYIEDAIKKGASAVVCHKAYEHLAGLISRHNKTAFAAVEDTHKVMAEMSAAFNDYPSRCMKVIGITGTNGKTSTSYIIKSILEGTGAMTGLVGTIQYMIGNEVYDSPHTTPESPVFHGLLREMADRGCNYIISEISSHALAQRRADCTDVSVAVFTNLTRDHLDFHRDMDEYFNTKLRLFRDLLIDKGTAVINIDDPYGRELCHILRDRDIALLTYGTVSREADIRADDIELTFTGLSYNLYIRGEFTERIISTLCGMTNVYNSLAAAAAVLCLNIPVNKIKEGIAMTSLVRGRFEKVELGQDFLAVVDYAHTEDALERLLMTARQLLNAYGIAKKTESVMRAKGAQYSTETTHKTGKIITVFGCGGNRDSGKRSKMGEIASRLSDFVIVTSDNPRNEDPKDIIREIEKGIKNDNYIVIPDRNVAIYMAVELASAGDIVLVAGKGHEDYQEIGGRRRSFSDKKALEQAIKKTITRPSFSNWAMFFNTDSKIHNAQC